jgi:hypothetical protein
MRQARKNLHFRVVSRGGPARLGNMCQIRRARAVGSQRNDMTRNVRKTLLVATALALMLALVQSCSGWTCTDCTVPAECVNSCPADQEFDGCFCIGGDAAISDVNADSADGD